MKHQISVNDAPLDDTAFANKMGVGDLLLTTTGRVYLRTYSQIVDLGNPSSTWTPPDDCDAQGRLLRPGESVTIRVGRA